MSMSFFKKWILAALVVFIVIMLLEVSVLASIALAMLAVFYFMGYSPHKFIFQGLSPRLITFWAVLIFLVLAGLSAFPGTGVFLMMLAAPVWIGLMIHVIALALVVDVLRSKLSPLVLILPILLYGAYYVSYIRQVAYFKVQESQLRADNPSQILEYDSNMHSLVMEGAQHFVARNKIPVAYEINQNIPEGYLSYRLVEKSECEHLQSIGPIDRPQLRAEQNLHRCNPVWSSIKKRGSVIRDKIETVSNLMRPENPDKSILEVLVEESKPRHSNRRMASISTSLNTQDFSIKEPTIKTYRFSLDGKEIGEFKTGYVPVLPPFPHFVVGCALIDMPPEWVCMFGPSYSKKDMNPYPAGVSPDLYGSNPIAAMLRIPAYKEDDLINFSQFEENREHFQQLRDSKKASASKEKNEWGLEGNSPYMPEIGEKDGVPSFTGKFYQDLAKGLWYEFIKENEGKVVYIDVQLDKVVNKPFFMSLSDVCKKGEVCNKNRVHRYNFENEDGSKYNWKEPGHYEGYWLVGESKVHNQEEGDTKTFLTRMSITKATDDVQEEISNSVDAYWDKKHKAEDCFFRDVEFPDDMLIYAAGIYEGKRLPDAKVLRGNHHQGQVDVIVNVPDKPVALLLSSHESSIWNISYTRETHILSVFIAGYYSQQLNGLKDETPVIFNIYKENMPCNYYVRFELNDLEDVNYISRRLFERPADMFFPEVNTGEIIIGSEDYDHSTLIAPDSRPVQITKKPRRERLGDNTEEILADEYIKASLENGSLRMATQEDKDKWLDRFEEKEKRSPSRELPPIYEMTLRDYLPQIQFRPTLVIMKDFECRRGIKKNQFMGLIVAEGAPWPSGNCSAFNVYDLNTLKCKGPYATELGNGWCNNYSDNMEAAIKRQRQQERPKK